MTKVLEQCVLRNARDYLLDLINCSQHGFILGKLYTTQLLEVHDYIEFLLEAGKETDVIYMEMSKPFDKVNHETLLNNLNNCNRFNISGNLLCWLRTYLLDHRQHLTRKTCIVRSATGFYIRPYTFPPLREGPSRCRKELQCFILMMQSYLSALTPFRILACFRVTWVVWAIGQLIPRLYFIKTSENFSEFPGERTRSTTT